jgi:hypothetical protein
MKFPLLSLAERLSPEISLQGPGALHKGPTWLLCYVCKGGHRPILGQEQLFLGFQFPRCPGGVSVGECQPGDELRLFATDMIDAHAVQHRIEREQMRTTKLRSSMT